MLPGVVMEETKKQLDRVEGDLRQFVSESYKGTINGYIIQSMFDGVIGALRDINDRIGKIENQKTDEELTLSKPNENTTIIKPPIKLIISGWNKSAF